MASNELTIEEQRSKAFADCFGRSPIPIALYNPAGIMIAANAALIHMLGVESEQSLLGLNLQENPAVPPELGDKLTKSEYLHFAADYDFDSSAAKARIRSSRHGVLHLDFTLTPWPIPGSDQMAILAYVQDCTEHKNMAHKLSMLSRAVEQGTTTVVITSTRGSIEYVNPAFCKSTGYTEKEVLGQNPRILKSGLMTPETYRKIYQALERGETWQGEFLNRRKSGELYWEYSYITPVRDPDGVIRHYMAVKEDITERKLAKSRLDLQYGITRTLATEQSIEGAAPRITQVLMEALACSYAELWILQPATPAGELVCLGSSASPFSAPGNQATPLGSRINSPGDPRMKALRSLGGTKLTTSDLKTVFAQPIRNDKGLAGVLVAGDLLNTDSNLHNALAAVASQIGQFILRLQVETEMRQLALVAQKTSNLVIIGNISEGIIWVNEGFEKITGYSLAEVIGRKPIDILHGPLTNAEVAKNIAEAVQDHREIRAEILNYKKSAEPFWADLLIQPIQGIDNSTQTYIAVGSDISRRKATEEDLLRAREEALHISKEKTAFLANMTRELRIPLEAISTMAHSMKQDEILDEEHHEQVSKISSSAEQLLSLLHAMGDPSHGANEAECPACPTDIRQGLSYNESPQASPTASAQRSSAVPDFLAPDTQAGNHASAATYCSSLPPRGSLPPLLYGIMEASLIADIGKLQSLLDLLEMKNPAMAERFRAMADKFDYAPIMDELRALSEKHV